MKKIGYKIAITFIVSLLFTSCAAFTDNSYHVSSPDGMLKFEVYTSQGQLYYKVNDGETEVFQESKLGLKFKNHSPLGEKLEVISSSNQSNNTTWEQPWGEKRLIEDRYEELLLELQETNGDNKK
jgi:hypothetical protein